MRIFVGSMKTLIIIVTYNAHQWLEQCLGSIDMTRYDVMVVDNCSTDDTALIIKTQYPKVVFRQMESNLGFGKANNVGLRYALDNNYDYVLLLNQDAWLLPDTIDKLIQAQQQNSEYWILSPIQMNTERGGLEKNFEKFLRQSGVEEAVIETFNKSKELHKGLDSSKAMNRNEGSIVDVRFVNAAIWLLSRRCIETVGGFDPLFPHYGEDNDYVNRVHYWRGKVGVVTNSVAYHEHPMGEKKITDEENIYHLKLVLLGELKNVNHSIYVSYLKSYWLIFRKVVKSAIRLNFNNVILILKMWHNINIPIINQSRQETKIQKAYI